MIPGDFVTIPDKTPGVIVEKTGKIFRVYTKDRKVFRFFKIDLTLLEDADETTAEELSDLYRTSKILLGIIHE